MALVKRCNFFLFSLFFPLSASSGRARTTKQLNKVAPWLGFEIKGGRMHTRISYLGFNDGQGEEKASKSHFEALPFFFYYFLPVQQMAFMSEIIALSPLWLCAGYIQENIFVMALFLA